MTPSPITPERLRVLALQLEKESAPPVQKLARVLINFLRHVADDKEQALVDAVLRERRIIQLIEAGRELQSTLSAREALLRRAVEALGPLSSEITDIEFEFGGDKSWPWDDLKPVRCTIRIGQMRAARALAAEIGAALGGDNDPT